MNHFKISRRTSFKRNSVDLKGKENEKKKGNKENNNLPRLDKKPTITTIVYEPSNKSNKRQLGQTLTNNYMEYSSSVAYSMKQREQKSNGKPSKNKIYSIKLKHSEGRFNREYKKKASKNHFTYYVSQVNQDWVAYTKNKNSDKQIDSLFINHLIHTLYIFKNKKYQSPPFKPHLSLPLNSYHQQTILFDLDETLVHSEHWQEANFYPSQKQIFIESGQGTIKSFAVNIRPYALEVLERLSKKFTLGVFTAGDKVYAQKVIQLLDPHRTIFTNRFYREHCYQNFNKQNIKDLRIFENAKLRSIVIVDNSPISFCFQKNNAIPIIPFIEDSNDDQLLKLESFVNMHILQAPDTRKVLSQIFRFEEFTRFQTVKEMIETIYKE